MEQNLDKTNLDITKSSLYHVITNTIEKPKRKIYPDITNKCHHPTKDDTGTIVKSNPLYLLCLLLLLLVINYTPVSDITNNLVVFQQIRYNETSI